MLERNVSDLPDLIRQVLDVSSAAPNDEWWFRGHGRSSWALVPSLYRHISDVGQALETEGRVLREFDNRSRMVVPTTGPRDAWELLFLMQHHFVPTRLLDWSRNLLIAAFFAVTDDEAWRDAADSPCVFVFNPKDWNSRVVGPAGMTAAGPSGVIGDLGEGIITSYGPRAPRTPVGPPQRHALAISGPEFAARMVAQRGVFTVFGTLGPDASQSLEQQEGVLNPASSTLCKLRLLGAANNWKRSLQLVGVGRFAAFPDLDGLARELREQYF